MNPNDRGTVSELKAITKLRELGYVVSTPFGDARYDLIAESPDGDLIKVQVKTGRWDSGTVTFQCRTKYQQKGEYHESHYTSDEIDAYAIYSYQMENVYWVPFDDAGKRGMRLRVEEPERSTSQTNWAEDYEMEKQLQ